MAKRFCDTDIWDKQWFMELSCKHKCLIRFLFDKCDVAGVWSANFGLASSYIGEKVTEADFEFLSSHIQKISEKKFFVVDFIEFQYGRLSKASPPHVKVIALLEKYGIKIKGYSRGIDTPQEEEEVKEEDMAMEEEKEKEVEKTLIPQMMKEFKKFNAKYPEDREKDFVACGKISKFIQLSAGIRFRAGPEFIKELMPYWTQISESVSNHSFFKNYSVTQIEKHLQSIVLNIQNGTGTNGKSNKPITGHDLKQAFAKYTGKQ